MPNQKESRWTDAQIRFTAVNHNLQDDEESHVHEDPSIGECDENSQGSSSTSSFRPEPTMTLEHRFTCQGREIEINLKGYEEEADAIYISTGLCLWKSAELMCEYMVQDGASQLLQQNSAISSSDGVRIIELGSGLGLVGLLAHNMLEHAIVTKQDKLFRQDQRGNKMKVVLTDGDVNALKALRNNVESMISDEKKEHVPIMMEQLLWGESAAKNFLEKQHSNKKFDIILAADAIYVKANVEPLLQTVECLLNRPHGKFWFSYCQRRQVSVSISDVLNAAETIGLKYRKVAEEADLLMYIFEWQEVAC